MKKFCSTCGNQLELSQRTCSGCKAANPFFVAAFTLLSDQRESLEKLRLEKERIDAEKARIEKELAEIEEAQKEFERQDELRKRIESLETQQAERMERERILLEQAERERIEAANLKKEIQRVKEEAEQYGKHLIVPERNEHVEIAQETYKEKNNHEPVVAVVTPTVVAPAVVEEQPETIHVEEPAATPRQPEPAEATQSNMVLRVLLGVVLVMGAFLTWFYFAQIDKPTSELSANTTEAGVSPEAIDRSNKVVDTVLSGEEPTPKKDTLGNAPVKVSPAVLTTGSTIAEVKSVSATPAKEKPAGKYALSAAKVKHDLTGKKIAGCGISIGSESELQAVSNIVMVEKTASYLKYKCHVEILQGNDAYTASPYLYYSPDGSFIKLDGTNCE
ncbi:MAG TPA: hypothetical protein VK154_00475 [Chitinophagales bacterium]|nr:hypothetical protein [Chitinophagales bacterium]